MAGYRRDIDRELDLIEVKVIDLLAVVCADLPEVTRAVLSGGTELGGQLAKRDRLIDALLPEVEPLVSRQVMLPAPAASDLRFLLTVLRVAPELERSQELECHIATRAGPHLAAGLSPYSRMLVQRAGEIACDLWRRASDCWYQRDASAGPDLAEVNEEMRELNASLVAELTSGQMPLPVTIEMTLIAHFYRRLGDHAVSIARRVAYMAGAAAS